MMLRSVFFRGADDRKRLVPRVGILRSFTRKNWPTVEATVKMNRVARACGTGTCVRDATDLEWAAARLTSSRPLVYVRILATQSGHFRR